MATAAAPSEPMRMDAEGAGSGLRKAQGPGLSQHEVEEELAGWEAIRATCLTFKFPTMFNS